MKNRKVATKASGKLVASAKAGASSKSAKSISSKSASKSSVRRAAPAKAPAKAAPKSSIKAAPKPAVKASSVKSLKAAPKAAPAKVTALKAPIAPVKNGAPFKAASGPAKFVKKGVVVPVAPVAPKAPAAPSINFRVGDKVVYPAHGVGIVDAIQTRKISTSEQSFYMLTVVETGMKIMVPVSQVDTVGLRRVVDSKTIDKVYDILRDRNVVTDTQTWNRRYREYTQKIKTGSVFEIASVIRDLIVLKGDKELSFGERKMLDTAQGLLVKEISIAKARPEDTVRAELMEMFQTV